MKRKEAEGVHPEAFAHEAIANGWRAHAARQGSAALATITVFFSRGALQGLPDLAAGQRTKRGSHPSPVILCRIQA